MTLVLAHLWPALAAAILLGAAVGALARGAGRWTVLAHLALLAGLAAASVLVQGRAALWLEAGALMLAAYAIGAGLGAFARSPRPAATR